MTLLVAWTGIDSRGPASVYIATDSRISWGNSYTFDHANKTFAIKRFPAIIGFCGDSLASQMLISQSIAVVEAIPDYASINLESLVNIFIRIIKRNYKQYPVEISAGKFTVIVCGKVALESTGSFECYRIDSNFKDTKKTKVSLPRQSGPIVIAGSGKNDFKEVYKKHKANDNPNKSTSRDVFHAFYKTILKGNNPTVGSIPQVTNVYRKPNTGGNHCGVVISEKRYIAGQLIDRDIFPKDIQCFNDNFEITNPYTKLKRTNAQVQPPYRFK